MPEVKPTQSEMLFFARYIRSFLPGRIRIRHPGLTRANLAMESRCMLMGTVGVTSVEINTSAGSVLILYEPSLLDNDTLISLGIRWVRWLEAKL